MDFSNIIKGINKAVETWEPILQDLPENTISNKRNGQSRTIKQILGHLIDSAANNHQRMIRLQYNSRLDFPDYQPENDLWISLQDYQNANWNNLIQLWKHYNIHMGQVINSIDQSKLDNSWQNFEGINVTLREMVEGYLGHIDLHLNEIKELISQ